MRRARILRLLPPLALGVGVAVWLVSTAEPPGRVTQEERAVTARTMTVDPAPVRPVVRGFGTVRPARSWQAVAEVSGAIVHRHPELETGNAIPAGTKVLEIDPERYETALQQAKADLAALRAEEDQIAAEAANTERLLEIENDRLALAERDLERVRNLVEQGTAPRARLDEQERATLQQRRGVQELKNSLALIPSRKAGLAARIARAEAARDRARRDLAKTRIETPFDLRVNEVHVERHQFVGSGQALVTGDGIDRAEVTAQLPIDSFPQLMGAAAGDVGGVGDGVRFDATRRGEVLSRIEATLRLVSDPGQVWQGKVLRIENALDPQARTVPVVIAVDNPYEGIRPPIRLPLVPNMYVEVILRGPAGAPRIAVPARALHQGDTIYLRDAEGRLELRNVTPGWRQEDIVVIADGLAPGDEVILDDIVPALPGMRVTPVAGDGLTEAGNGG